MSFKLGKQAEEFVIKIFNDAKLNANKSEVELLEYDIEFLIGKTKYTAEIKFDYMSVKTGNLAIEYWNSKKNTASGITSTKATIWVHCILDSGNITAWVANTIELTNYIRDNKPKKTIIGAGDNNACIHLYDVDKMLKDVFMRIDHIIDRSEFAKIIKKKVKLI
jgi:hypothetical protein